MVRKAANSATDLTLESQIKASLNTIYNKESDSKEAGHFLGRHFYKLSNSNMKELSEFMKDDQASEFSKSFGYSMISAFGTLNIGAQNNPETAKSQKALDGFLNLMDRIPDSYLATSFASGLGKIFHKVPMKVQLRVLKIVNNRNNITSVFSHHLATGIAENKKKIHPNIRNKIISTMQKNPQSFFATYLKENGIK